MCGTIPTKLKTLQNGYDIRTVKGLLGHKDVETTMIYTHVPNRGSLGVRRLRTGLKRH